MVEARVTEGWLGQYSDRTRLAVREVGKVQRSVSEDWKGCCCCWQFPSAMEALMLRVERGTWLKVLSMRMRTETWLLWT